MGEIVEINGKNIDREAVRTWLKDKRCTLWSDWCITDPRRMESAIDWFMGEIQDLGAH